MDRTTFDAISRLYAGKASRRAALASLIAAGLLVHQNTALQAKKRVRRRRKRSKGADGADGADGVNSGAPTPTPANRCYPGTTCTPGGGAPNAHCDFSHSTLFRGLNARGSDLSGTNLSFADATAADFRGAALSNACLVGATLRHAIIDGSTTLNGAIFCHTVMPDGSINDRDCAIGSDCCPTTAA